MATTKLVPCYWCGMEDLAAVKTTPWLRYCPLCRRVTLIERGEVNEARTLREQAKQIEAGA